MKKLFLLVFLPFVLAGCFQVKTKEVTDGGVYRSKDKAETFEQITHIASVSATKNFSNDNTVFLKPDPTDANSLFYSSTQAGLLASYNNGTSWRTLLKNKGTVKEVLVNPNNACEIYASTKQNIFKTLDCGRVWGTSYIEKVSKRSINDIVIDFSQPNRLFMFLSDGSILLSEDSGNSWQVWSRIESPGKKAFVNPKNTQIMYMTSGSNFFKSTDQGKNWFDYKEKLTKDYEFKNSHKVSELIFIPEYDDAFFTISTYGVLRSLDGGETWEDLPLLPRPAKDVVLSLSANPGNMNELYYSTKNAVYYSNDGGVNWKTIKSPTKRYNQIILMHPKDPNVVFIGAYSPPKK